MRYFKPDLNKMKFNLFLGLALATSVAFAQAPKPNVLIIYADDLGYGDLSCYGSKVLHTPNIDALAKTGLLFTNGHTTSPTCTPSRYGLMTGKYPWRQEGTGILPGDAKLIVPTDKTTLPKVFKQAGYQTAIVGKWHLGLGTQVEKNWNGEVTPGPNEVGFDYSFIFPATADRVPTVFMENHKVLATDPKDPIVVSYKEKVGADPTGKEHPELLKMHSSVGHDGTIVNGIGRIGFMSGGYKARWVDEELTYTFIDHALSYIKEHAKAPFMLCYNSTEPHVPRMPATQFKGKSGLGYRGDAILQLDWAVGQLVDELKKQGVYENTLILLSSDNGPVLDDGYHDQAKELYKGEQLGPLRGGKYSLLEGGTRVPFIASWPGQIKAGKSDALMSQVDFVATFAALVGTKVPAGDAPDSENQLQALLGKSATGKSVLIEGNTTRGIAIVKGEWKYIKPNNGNATARDEGVELGNSKMPQLFNLKDDVAEKNNLASKHPDKVKELSELLEKQIKP